MIREAVLAIANSAAASIVLKTTLTVTVALAAAALAGRSRAAIRHAILAAAFGVLLILPLAAIYAPPLRIQVRTPSAVAPAPSGSLGHAQPRIAAAPVVPGGLPAGVLVASAWMAGTAIFLLPVAAGLWQLRKLRRSARTWKPGTLEMRCDVLVHDTVSGPMTCGVFRPAVIMPAAAQYWPAGDVERALVHELEHVRRFDWLVNCAARVICAFYWFHPLVWIAWRKLALEAERSCDDAVLKHSEPSAYAEQLVALARSLTDTTRPPLLAMASRADLAARVRSVLDSRRPRGRAGVAVIALACACAALVVLTLSPLTLTAAPQPQAPMFQTKTQLVQIQAVVTDASGRIVEGLTPEDLVVMEDGTPQQVTNFESDNGFYILGYYSSKTGPDRAFHQLTVTYPKDPAAKVRTRAGFFSGATQPPPAPPAAGVSDPSVTAPAIIFKKNPEYSEEARKAKYQGIVVLEVEVDTSGLPSNIRVVRSLGLGLDEKAIEAVKQWRFRPGRKNGYPVALKTLVSVDFRLL